VTIRRGAPWGEPGTLPAGAPLARTDAEVARAIGSGPVGLLGGDLCRTVGGTGDEERLRGPEAVRLPCDALRVDLDGRVLWAVAHVVVHGPPHRGGPWRGPVHAVMNAQYVGRYDVAPRSHPNDGRADVISGNPSWRVRWAVLGRLASGTHLPHPELTERKLSTWTSAVNGPIWVDGVRIGRVGQVSIEVVADALIVVV
jgi:hypothetical protein